MDLESLRKELEELKNIQEKKEYELLEKNELLKKELLKKDDELRKKDDELLKKDDELLQEKKEKEDLLLKHGLNRLLLEALPQLLKGGAGSTSASSITKGGMFPDGKRARHIAIDKFTVNDFNCLDVGEINEYSTNVKKLSSLWQLAIVNNNKSPILHYSSEAMVQNFVSVALADILQFFSDGDKYKVFLEIQIDRNRPDIWVIQNKDMLPICICEVKEPGKNVLDSLVVLGQLFDYMVMLRTLYGTLLMSLCGILFL